MPAFPTVRLRIAVLGLAASLPLLAFDPALPRGWSSQGLAGDYGNGRVVAGTATYHWKVGRRGGRLAMGVGSRCAVLRMTDTAADKDTD